MVRDPRPAQTNWEAGGAGQWPLRETDALGELGQEGILGAAQGRLTQKEPDPR